MKLNLGCGTVRKQGFVNVDAEETDAVDQVVDLNVLPWPWPDGSVDEVFAGDALEHLAPLGRAAGQLNIIAVMGEIHRVMEPGGLLEIISPSTDGPGAWQDPTHVTYWNKNTFLYFLQESPYAWVPGTSRYPKFTIDERDLGIADSELDDYGVVWVCARLRKPVPKPEGGGAVEGADAA